MRLFFLIKNVFLIWSANWDWQMCQDAPPQACIRPKKLAQHSTAMELLDGSFCFNVRCVQMVGGREWKEVYGHDCSDATVQRHYGRPLGRARVERGVCLLVPSPGLVELPLSALTSPVKTSSRYRLSLCRWEAVVSSSSRGDE